jgi:hypothetical protein
MQRSAVVNCQSTAAVFLPGSDFLDQHFPWTMGWPPSYRTAAQIDLLRISGADMFFDQAVPKFAAQAMRKIYDIGWRPLHMLAYVSSSVNVTLKPAGLDKCVGSRNKDFLI